MSRLLRATSLEARWLRRPAPGVFWLLCLGVLLTGCSREPELPYFAPGTRVLAFGDSLTFGTGAKTGQSYPARVAEATGWELRNAGVPGELAEDGLLRLQSLLQEDTPALVLLCHGGNNLLRGQPEDRIRSQLASMIELARAQGAQVVLLGVPKPTLLMRTAGFYADLAEEYGLVYLPDAIADTLSDPALKSDQAHPNAAGYASIADQLVVLLRESGAL
ncbi:GDSL-type esterase/lipase family protein [Marinobacterium sedimentorum]|uniref:GDSL-type esterase/lipase family protein n=1 Tax=Marinobacterium sedimentorum TaxID=2927804 RepID=UPI0020C6F5AB|nr:GDSL-type esterase/lipase family protein [Marinobacterium sedimentorum]MCP8690233.1 GDSL-type esterase/lipase family protein [Marinobacterium sedimentorum]